MAVVAKMDRMATYFISGISLLLICRASVFPDLHVGDNGSLTHRRCLPKVEEQVSIPLVLQLDVPQLHYPRDHEKILDAILWQMQFHNRNMVSCLLLVFP